MLQKSAIQLWQTASAKGLTGTGSANLQRLGTVRDETTANELAFLRATDRGRNCLILAQRQAIYHAELNTASPVPGPGLVETLLAADLDKLQAAAVSPQVKCLHLGVRPNSQTLAKLDDVRLMAYFTVSGKNSLGTLWLLEPQQAVTTGN